MGFWNFYYAYGGAITVLLMFPVFLFKSTKMKFFALFMQIVSLSCQLYSIQAINEDRLKAHFQKGSCYASYSGARYHIAMVTEVGKEEYTYAIYLEADARFGDTESFFIIDSRHPDTYPFAFFERVYPAKIDCPNVTTKVI